LIGSNRKNLLFIKIFNEKSSVMIIYVKDKEKRKRKKRKEKEM